MGQSNFDPKWWTVEHASRWDATKEAMKRDWEQTKSDFGAKARDLNQDAKDTVKQAVGKQPIPAPGQPTPSSKREFTDDVASSRGSRGTLPTGMSPGIQRWEDAEEAYRYGVGARAQFERAHAKWDNVLESTLEKDWKAAGADGHRTWDEVKLIVKRAYERATTR